MFYCPGKFVFIHIPRTGGMSITTALSRSCFGRVDVIAGTAFGKVSALNRHATANELAACAFIGDWHKIAKYAVYRDTQAIIGSDYRLHRQSIIDTRVYNRRYTESLQRARSESLDQFRRRRWQHWLGGKSAWEFWTGSHNVRKMRFRNLEADFAELLRRHQLPIVELPRLNATKKKWDPAHILKD